MIGNRRTKTFLHEVMIEKSSAQSNRKFINLHNNGEDGIQSYIQRYFNVEMSFCTCWLQVAQRDN
jgi:hypothetical protein